MSVPVFYINELNNNFPELESFRTELYKKNILSKDYVEDNLFLVYHKFDQQSTTDLDRECRSLVLDRTTKKIVSFSCETPILNSQALEYLLLNQQVDKVITKCYEGTLLSVFYHGSKWYVSTRRCLNSNESVWGDNKSHFDMFMEVLNNSGYESLDSFTNKLNKDYCYYFVLIHHQNKNVVDYESEFGKDYKKLSLLFVREKETQNEVDLYNSTFDLSMLNDNIFLSEKINSLEEFDSLNKKDQFTLPPKSEGVVIKCFDENVNRFRLLKLQTMSYQFAKSIGSEKNIFMGLIHLYQNGKLTEYVNQMPNLKKIVNPLNTHESFDTIGAIDALFKVCTSELFELFKVLWDIKNGKHLNDTLYKLLPKEYKDVMFGIRGIYFKKKAKLAGRTKSESDSKNPGKHLEQSEMKEYHLQIKDIYQYLKTMQTENFCAFLRMRKLMFNWAKVNSEVSEFGKISSKCDKVHFKLTSIYTNKLFPNIMPDDIPTNVPVVVEESE
jgi:hypothetical protein